MKITYTTTGTCSRFIDIELAGDRIKEVRFIGGCAGNAKGLAALAADQPIEDVIRRTRGIICRAGTSCPDQLARALESVRIKQAV